jgi:hypothetical protein
MYVVAMNVLPTFRWTNPSCAFSSYALFFSRLLFYLSDVGHGGDRHVSGLPFGSNPPC